MTNRSVALSLILSLVYLPVLAQTSASDTDLLTRIRKEEGEHSQIMKTIHMLADVYGPRLTGSPNHKNAAEWAIKQMKSWGLENAHLEPWDFGHPGWLNERLTAHLISPVKDPLVCEVLSWTPGTKGTVQAKAYQLFLPERPTQDQLTAFFAKEKTKVRGKIVLAGRHTVVPISLTPPAKRLHGLSPSHLQRRHRRRMLRDHSLTDRLTNSSMRF
jgi:carboxypeptidase Q